MDVYSINPCAEGCRIGDVPVISCVNYKKLLKYLRPGEICRYSKIFIRSLPDVKKAFKNIFWYLTASDIERLIKKNDYDIIHIHGVSFCCFITSLAAARCKKPFLFTMHGLISYGIPGITKLDASSEQAALSVIKDNNFVVTTVSSGTKRIPCEDRGIDSNKISVINNAVKCTVPNNPEYWYTRFPQIKGKKKFVGIGTIGPGKNQIQILRAFLLLPKDVQDNMAVILAGKDRTNGEFENFVTKHDLQNHVFMCGFVSKDDLSNLYAIADYNIMLSISEGFGLSMIEAARFGIPSLTFSDLDAVKDIYSPNSMLAMNDRTDETVADGIQKMLTRLWNKELIIKESLKFNEDIYLQYLDVYKKILENGSNMIDPKDIMSAIGL